MENEMVKEWWEDVGRSDKRVGEIMEEKVEGEWVG